MLFGVKNQQFVSATFHHSRHGIVLVGNVAAISLPKIVYPDIEKNSNKLKFSTDLINFYVIWQLTCMATFISQEVGNLSTQ